MPDSRSSGRLNEVRARLATPDELEAFQPYAELALSGRIVLELSHITYGNDDQPLEAVVSVRPATDNVIAFETDERADGAS